VFPQEVTTMKLSHRALAVAAVIALGGLVSAGSRDRWIHVRVTGEGSADRVSVNLPLQMVASFLPMVQAGELGEADVDLDLDLDLDHELGDVYLAALVRAVRESEDGEFVRIDGPREAVRVAKQGSALIVHVDEANERVRVRLPLAVVEAFAATKSQTLDVEKILDALAEFDGQDLITVEGPGESVRVWIDSSEAGER
jgi:hypothetical protein